MKKLNIVFISVILCMFASVTFSQNIIIAKKKSAGADYYCDTCPDATGGGDVLCERPDSSADGLCGWTLVETTGDIDFTNSPDNNPALGCTDIPMTYDVRLTRADTTDADCYAYKEITGTSQYLQFYIKMNSWTGLAASQSLDLVAFTLYSDYESGSVRFLVVRSSSVYHFKLTYYTSTFIDDTSTTNISLDTWYGVRIKVVNPAGGGSDVLQWWIDYNNDGDFADAGEDEGEVTGLTLGRVIGYLRIGAPSGGQTSVAHTFEVTGIKLDDDTMPSDCAR